MQDELREIFLTQIQVNPYQPRRSFAQEELEELAQSIKTVGLLHPPLVREIRENVYELVSGERRFRACLLAGLSTMHVVVRRSTDMLSAQAALVENIQRVDLNPLEIAKALRSLHSEFGWAQEELAHRVGKKRSTIANYMRLLSLPLPIQESVRQGSLTMGHAKAILALEKAEEQTLLYELILRDDLNVRQAEEAALRIAQKVARRAVSYVNRDFYLEQLAQKIQQKLGTKVSMQGKGKKGRITIDYYNFDDLDRLLEIFGVN